MSKCPDRLNLARVNQRDRSLEQCINEALKDAAELKILVDKIMEMMLRPRDSGAFFGRTTKTAFRKLHEIYVSTFDQLNTLASKNKACNEDSKKLIVPLLVRAKVVTSYQAARRLVHTNVMNLLDMITNNIYTIYVTECREENNEAVARAAEHARLILDSLVVVAEKSLR